MKRTHACFIATSLFAVGALLAVACDEKHKKTPRPVVSTTVYTAPVLSSAEPLPPLELEVFEGLGLRFNYPKPYKVETASKNPEIHQVALDHNEEPGVLTIRFNPKTPGASINLDEVAEATRQRMGAQSTVEPSKLKVAGTTYDARTVKANQLGLVDTIDVAAIVPIGATNYIVVTHVSHDDQNRAQRMFNTVLGSVAKSEIK